MKLFNNENKQQQQQKGHEFNQCFTKRRVFLQLEQMYIEDIQCPILFNLQYVYQYL